MMKYPQGAVDNHDEVSSKNARPRMTFTHLVRCETNRIYHRSSMQTEKSQPMGKRITLEKSFTKYPVLSVDPRVGISRSASETDD